MEPPLQSFSSLSTLLLPRTSKFTPHAILWPRHTRPHLSLFQEFERETKLRYTNKAQVYSSSSLFNYKIKTVTLKSLEREKTHSRERKRDEEEYPSTTLLCPLLLHPVFHSLSLPAKSHPHPPFLSISKLFVINLCHIHRDPQNQHSYNYHKLLKMRAYAQGESLADFTSQI